MQNMHLFKFTMFGLILFTIYLKSSFSEDYQGHYLGKFNTYFHQVSGDVYVVDDHTFLIKSFFYDGLGKDTYFWAGTSIRPSNIGFLVGNEHGRTNVLKRYIHNDIVIKLPEDRRVRQLKWLAIWDISTNQNFGDIYIPDDFQPPSPQRISQFSRLSNGIKSDPIIILNSKMIKIPFFSFDGLDENAFFYVGNGPQPNSNGEKIPNELGYYDNLGKYDNEDIVLHLPGEKTIFDIDWLAVWNDKLEKNLGSVIIPDSSNIPPLINNFIKYESFFPNCEQLHRRLQLSWEIFGPQVTFELAGQVDHDDYIAIGLTNSNSSKLMIGSDVALLYINDHLGHVIDFNLTDKFPCTNVLGNYYGVCPDTKLGGIENFQLNQFKRMDGLNVISFRRNLKNDDPSDIEFKRDEVSRFVWAIGKLNKQKEPRLHYIYPKKATYINLFRNNTKRCYPFSQTVFSSNKVVNSFNIETKLSERNNKQDSIVHRKNWGPLRILNQTSTTFYARLGVPGGPEKGYSSMTSNMQHSPGLVWYISGLMSPILYVRRGVTYTFRVEGGSDPLNTRYYNPLYLTTDPNGGYAQLNENDRKTIRVISGITFDKKGRPTPTAVGRYCVWEYSNDFDSRKSDNFVTFIQFRNHLNYTCEKNVNSASSLSSLKDQAGLLVWTPNASTPDVIYYQSYTQRNMGWKIIVLDDFNGAAQLLASTGSTTGSSSTFSSNLYLNVIFTYLITMYIIFNLFKCIV